MKKGRIIASLGLAVVLCASCIQASSYAATDEGKDQLLQLVVNESSRFDWSGIKDFKVADGTNVAMNANSVDTSKSCEFKGASNSTGGWTLTAYGVYGNSMTSSSGATIPSLPLNTDSPLTAGTANWGYQAAKKGTTSAPVDGKWRGISGSETNQTEMIHHTDGGEETTYTIWYGFATSATQTADTYAAYVHYTFATI